MKNYIEIIDWDYRLLKLDGNKQVVLYGAGKYGQNALKNIRKYLPQLEVLGFIDDDRIRNSLAIDGVEIFYLSEAIDELGEFSIIITNYYVKPVLEKIQALGFDINKVFYWSELLIEDISQDILETNRYNLESAYNYLNDYRSKFIFKSMVESRWTKNTDLLSLTCESNQYFPRDIIKLGDDEVFVDGGGYDGDTVEQFLRFRNGQYKHIYSFEPDQQNYNKLINRGYSGNITVYNAGLYRETTQLCFSANRGGSSKIEPNGTDVISVYKFDELDIANDKVTFIKMDIEGGELDALMGMERTIKRWKPKLAICIYHKFEDLWELPLYIKNLVPDYKLYIRNHTPYLDEIVLYATI